jgi:hypothetical protein
LRFRDRTFASAGKASDIHRAGEHTDAALDPLNRAALLLAF